MTRIEDTTRVYIPGGKRAHLLQPLSSPNSNDAALCGFEPFEFWYGTGTQEEMDKASTKPLCKRCERRIET